MKYYAHYGHKDFVLCLGHRAEAVKNYFLNYNECASNDFVLSGGGKNLELLNSDIHDWRITFADTGISSNIGQRLKAVEKYLEGEEEFLANYSDGLTDLPLPNNLIIFTHRTRSRVFFASARTSVITLFPWQTATTTLFPKSTPLTTERFESTVVSSFLRKDLRLHARQRRARYRALSTAGRRKQLIGYRYDGFWASMDTFKDKQQLESLCAGGAAPWEVWKTSGNHS